MLHSKWNQKGQRDSYSALGSTTDYLLLLPRFTNDQTFFQNLEDFTNPHSVLLWPEDEAEDEMHAVQKAFKLGLKVSRLAKWTSMFLITSRYDHWNRVAKARGDPKLVACCSAAKFEKFVSRAATQADMSKQTSGSRDSVLRVSRREIQKLKLKVKYGSSKTPNTVDERLKSPNPDLASNTLSLNPSEMTENTEDDELDPENPFGKYAEVSAIDERVARILPFTPRHPARAKIGTSATILMTLPCSLFKRFCSPYTPHSFLDLGKGVWYL